MTQPKGRNAFLRSLVLLVLCLGACAPAGVATGPAARTDARPRVAEHDPARAPYDRDQWEPHGWLDADGDGCNTRAEALMSESTVATRHRAGSCTVVSGRWVDPYTGRVILDAAQVQIDHLVSLSDAHASGGWAWPPERKAAFANDLTEEWALNATWGAENQRKADLGPDRWLPPEASFGCTYVSAYARIKARWGLTVTPAQWSAVETTWRGCGQ